MRIQLNLARTIKQDKTIVRKFLQLCHEPVDVLHKMLHAINQTAIGSPILNFLDIIKGNQVSNVDVAFVLEGFCCRIEIANFYGPALLFGNFLDYMAECGFA